MQSYDYLFKVIIIGDAGVGKSCLLLQFCQSTYRQNHVVTLGVEFGTRIVELEDARVKLQLWDTAGSEEFRSVTRSYYRGAAAALLVYDVTNRKTFESLEGWLNEAKISGSPLMDVLIVGNKSDQIKEIESHEGKAFADVHDLQFVETSAKVGDNVQLAFELASRLVLKRIQLGALDPNNFALGVKLGKRNVQKVIEESTEKKTKKCCN